MNVVKIWLLCCWIKTIPWINTFCNVYLFWKTSVFLCLMFFILFVLISYSFSFWMKLFCHQIDSLISFSKKMRFVDASVIDNSVRIWYDSFWDESDDNHDRIIDFFWMECMKLFELWIVPILFEIIWNCCKHQ